MCSWCSLTLCVLSPSTITLFPSWSSVCLCMVLRHTLPSWGRWSWWSENSSLSLSPSQPLLSSSTSSFRGTWAPPQGSTESRRELAGWPWQISLLSSLDPYFKFTIQETLSLFSVSHNTHIFHCFFSHLGMYNFNCLSLFPKKKVLH